MGILVVSPDIASAECLALNRQFSLDVASSLPGHPNAHADVSVEILRVLITTIPLRLTQIVAILIFMREILRTRYKVPDLPGVFYDTRKYARMTIWIARAWSTLRALRLAAVICAGFFCVNIITSGFVFWKALAAVGCLIVARLMGPVICALGNTSVMQTGGPHTLERIFARNYPVRILAGTLIRSAARLLALFFIFMYVSVAGLYALGGQDSWYADAARQHLASTAFANFTAKDLYILTLISLVGLPLGYFVLSPLVIIGTMYFIDRLGMRVMAQRAEVYVNDNSQFILYLRNFGDDKARIGTASQLTLRSVLSEYNLFRRARFEEIVVQRLNVVAPVVALSDPRVKLSHLGSAKLAASNDNWFDLVRTLSNDALAVVMLASPRNVNDGLKAEINFLATELEHERVILMLTPAVSRNALMKRWQMFWDVAKDNALKPHEFYNGLDVVVAGGAAQVIVRADNRWQAWGMNTKTEASYIASLDLAVDHAIERWGINRDSQLLERKVPSGDDRDCRQAVQLPLPLSEEACEALTRLPRLQLPLRTVTTGMLFCALSEVDVLGRWDRIWLTAGYPPALTIQAQPDALGHEDVVMTWEGVAVTRQVAVALEQAVSISRKIDADIIHPRALIVALILDPTSGATIALMKDTAISHQSMIKLFQQELLGIDL